LIFINGGEVMRTVLVDYRIEDEERYNLEKIGFEVLPVPPSSVLYEAVCGHPDMLLHIVDSSTILIHKDMDFNFIDMLKNRKFKILMSHVPLQNSYPNNITLNAVNLKSLFAHNLKYTDLNLLECVQNKKKLNVKQGYSKCSTAIVSEDAVMTSDKGIAACLKQEGLDVLLLPPGDILLPGLSYGFIGGCCGLIEKNVLAFYGHLNHYAYRNEVKAFLQKHRIDPIFLRDGKLVDRGSIFAI
jgi:hypothetical protein